MSRFTALGPWAVMLLLLSCDRAGEERRSVHAQERPPAREERSPVDAPAPSRFAETHPRFERYWYQGLAELDRYALTQARYGELRDGEAVLVFVTEDFRADRQVKYEGGPRDNVESVLKVNAYRRFVTGIYPYTVLTSTFTPVRAPALLPFKLSASVQEWCGHTYMQLNRRQDGFELDSHSYFDREGDERRTLPAALLEDQLWAQLRHDPSSLPTGDISMIPAAHFLRFAHRPAEPVEAVARKDTITDARFGEGELGRYSVSYPSLGRELRIIHGLAFPFEILGWEEVEPAREGGEALVTRAVRTHALMTDYWNHNGNDDAAFRDALGLSPPR